MTDPLVINTPVEDHLATLGLMVKREDLSCPPPGPPFSKTRGVLAWAQRQWDAGTRTFGVLDTVHSQGGWAVAHACHLLGARCLNYYPVYVGDPPGELRPFQQHALGLGAELRPLPAGRSAVLYHRAKRDCEAEGGVMFPNALKLDTTVTQTAAEVVRTLGQYPRLGQCETWLVSASSGTIAAGLVKGLEHVRSPINLIVHMGYSRSEPAVRKYIHDQANTTHPPRITVVNEGYAYKDKARAGPLPPWPCNPWYDLKTFRWWMAVGIVDWGEAVFWNIG